MPRPELVAATALTFLLASCSAEAAALHAGPLPVPDPHGYGGITVDVGQTFTDGFEVLWNDTGRPVEIISVELTDSPEALELVGVVLAGDDRQSNFQFDPAFPPDRPALGTLVDAEGATLVPVSEQTGMLGQQLLMGIRVKAPGRWVRGGYRVTYEVDGRRHAWDAVAQITVCTAEFTEPDGSCPLEE